MKKTLLAIALSGVAFFATAQHSYITTSDFIILEDGAIETYDTPTISVDAVYRTSSETWVATLRLTPDVVISATSQFVKTFQLEFTDAEVAAFTGSGANEVQIIKNCILQAVADNLEAINPTVTFTLN